MAEEIIKEAFGKKKTEKFMKEINKHFAEQKNAPLPNAI
jgi:hypothetical protein